MSRNIDNKNLLGRNIINKSIGNVVKDINNIKTKYDFNSDVAVGSLLIGNDDNNYTSNTLTAGTNVSITNSSGNITISSTDTDTNFFQKSSSNISPLNTSDNILVGTNSNPNNRKLLVNGGLESSSSLSGVYVSDFGLTDSNFNIQISSSISGKLRIGASATNRVVEIYNGGYLITFPTISSNDKLVLENATQTLTNKSISYDQLTNTPTIPSQFFQKSSSNISPLNTSDNILVGTNSNPNNRKLLVNGGLESTSSKSGLYVSNGGLTDDLGNIQISSSVSGKLIIGASATSRATEIYSSGYKNTFPSATSDDKFVLEGPAQTLTFKTLLSPVIETPNIRTSNTFNILNIFSGIITFGNSTDLSDLLHIRKITAPSNQDIINCDTANVIQIGNSTDTTNIQNCVIDAPTLTGSTGISGIRCYIEDQSINHFYNIKVSELTQNRDLRLPVLTNNDGNFVVDNVSQELTNKTLNNPVLTGINAGSRMNIHDSSMTNFYTIKTNELTANREIKLPLLTESASEFIASNTIQTMKSKTIQTTQGNNMISSDNAVTGIDIIVVGNSLDHLVLGEGSNVGIGVQNPRARLDLARNYPGDFSVNSGEATSIFLNVKNISGDSSGIVWKPNFSGYSKSSAYINFEPTGNFFRGELHFGANNTSDNFSDARKVMVIRQSGQYIFSNPITWSPVSTGNNWYPATYLEGNVSSTIAGGALNNGGTLRKYVWAVESTANSYRALGLFTNNTDSLSDTNGSTFTFMGFFSPFTKSTSYSFTASHRCYSNNSELYNEDKIGLIVQSTGQYDSLYIDNISVDNAVPIVELSNSRKSKKVLGVISRFETNDDKREGMDYGYIQVSDKDKNRLYINSIGEGAVWVCNTNGNFENGDYIQSSDISGYGEKQDDDILHNYSVAKITMDVDFDNIPENFEKRILENDIISVFVGAIYQQG